MASREELIRSPFTKAMRLIEIGPRYHPIVPKCEGWQTTVVDHAGSEELSAKYRGSGVDVECIEPVDIICPDGAISDAFPAEQFGQFDGLIASHVGKHFPDLVGFLKAADRLLRPDGIIALALPDKRAMFDFFRPLTMTGDLLAAHSEGRVRHSARTRFNWLAYSARSNDQIGWARDTRANLNLENTLNFAWRAYQDTDERPETSYEDAHAWVFTPASFELVILELNQLGIIPWFSFSIRPAPGVEFYAWLSRHTLDFGSVALNDRRLQLLKMTVAEVNDQLQQLAPEEPKSAAVRQTNQSPSIAAIIPLYNGASYIETALRSVLEQTLAPCEIIVVNHGSTDSGPSIVEHLTRHHPIRMLHKENGGQSSARNFGVAHSTAALIGFLDQDDIWYPTHLQELMQPFISRTDGSLGWAYSDLDEIDQNGSMVCRNFLSSLGTSHPKNDLCSCLGSDMFVLPSASLISQDAFARIGGFDERLSGYEDDDLFLRLFRSGYRNVFVEKALSQWRIYAASSSYSFRMGRSRMLYARKLFQEFPDERYRNRFFARDILAPRFFPRALEEFKAALLTDDLEMIKQAWEDVHYVISFLDRRRNARLRITLALLRSAKVAQLTFAARRWLRPLMLRALRPA